MPGDRPNGYRMVVCQWVPPGTAKLLSIKPKPGLTHLREYEAYIKASHFKDTLSVEEIYDKYLNKHWTVFVTSANHLVQSADPESMLILWNIILPEDAPEDIPSHNPDNW
jgi:hypothetical protein